MIKRFLLLLIGILLGWQIQAQEFNFPMTKLPLSDWQLTNANWTKSGDIQLNPFEAKKVKMTAGENLLTANGKGDLISSKTQVSDVKLRFEFMLGAGGETIFSLGKVGIVLNNSWDGVGETPCGAIQKPDGIQVPLQNAGKATGLWQTLELTFSAAKNGVPATFENVILNGVTIHENYFVGNATDPTYSFSFLNKAGIMAIRNFEYLPLSDNKPLKVSNLAYKVYDVWQWGTKPDQKPAEEGNSETLTQEYATSYKNFSMIYTGKMDVAKTATYLFSADYAGTLSLKIDGKDIINNTEYVYRIPQNGSVDLTQGTHTFELKYARVWWKPGLGLYVTAAGIRPYALHVPASLPEPDAVGEIAVNPSSTTEIIRSFILFNGKKRTHSVSVGSPEGIHYSFDLDQGALLYAWKGQFADLTDMWYERGEPQLLKPKGAILTFSGKPAVATLANEGTAFADSLDPYTAIVYKGYALDNKGFPTYSFDYSGTKVTQKIMPEEKGLTYTMEANGTAKNLFCKIAEGKKIQQIDKGLYLVDDYYVKLADKTKPTIRNSSGGQEIILPLTSSLSYSIIW